MTVQTQVGEADVAKLRQGMSSYFTTLGSPGRRFYGQLRKIEPTPTVTNNVVLYNALFDVPNPNKVLMPQMTAQVFFVVAEARDVLTVPVAALTFQRATRTQVAVDNGDGEAVATKRAEPTDAQRANRPRRGRSDATPGAPATPRRAIVKVATSNDERNPIVVEREVTVGVASRVNAEILSGLKEGERVVAGIKVADAPAKSAAPTRSATPLGPAGGGFRR
jgi:macrolide-specific efflux system membrane fusion protein